MRCARSRQAPGCQGDDSDGDCGPPARRRATRPSKARATLSLRCGAVCRRSPRYFKSSERCLCGSAPTTLWPLGNLTSLRANLTDCDPFRLARITPFVDYKLHPEILNFPDCCITKSWKQQVMYKRNRCGPRQVPRRQEGREGCDKGQTMSLGPILLIVVVLMLLGVLPVWPHASSWGYRPRGTVGVILVILVVPMTVGCRSIGRVSANGSSKRRAAERRSP